MKPELDDKAAPQETRLLVYSSRLIGGLLALGFVNVLLIVAAARMAYFPTDLLVARALQSLAFLPLSWASSITATADKPWCFALLAPGRGGCMAALRMAGSLGRPSGFFRTLAFRYLVESPDCATPALSRTHSRCWSSEGIRFSIDIRLGLCSDVWISRTIGRNAMSRHFASSHPAGSGIGSSDRGRCADRFGRSLAKRLVGRLSPRPVVDLRASPVFPAGIWTGVMNAVRVSWPPSSVEPPDSGYRHVQGPEPGRGRSSTESKD